MKKVIGIVLIFLAIADLIAMYPLFMGTGDALSPSTGESESVADLQMYLLGLGVGNVFFIALVCGVVWCLRKKPIPQGPELPEGDF